MRLDIQEDTKAVVDYTATYINNCIIQFKPTSRHPFALRFLTGSSLISGYKILAIFYQDGELSFEHVVTFNTDEYVGLSSSHPKFYRSFIGYAPDLDRECSRYEAVIRRIGLIRLNGHIIFNEPDMAKLPRVALTVGVAQVVLIEAIMDYREVLIIITGVRKTLKAIALAECIEQGIYPKGLIVCYEDETLELHVKTVKYFKPIEHIQQEIIKSCSLILEDSYSIIKH
ncbi:glucosamine-6-phosphate isomerase [Phycomyces blakesleeanus]|uniref:Glucosamine-6-phosphate isomerase n=1 Tax=Phycomyces blakesleeanus TaxID=4837 RepID=A0ABR3AWF9_PHYBL